MEFLGKILPVDGYQVQVLESLPIDYNEALIHLYQPLIGIEAVSLYEVLLKENALQQAKVVQTHHTLMNYLNIPLDKLYKARLKLEGIGLLKTYKKDTEERTMFTYMIQAPFRPATFFDDLMLSELLYRHVGKARFTILKEHYAVQAEADIGEELTASFKDVFQTFRPKNGDAPIERKQEVNKGVPLAEPDFTMIEQWLRRRNVQANKVLTTTNKRIITQLIQLYDLEMYELEQAINWAITEGHALDIEQLKAACHDLFQGKQNVVQVGLYEKEKQVLPTPLKQNISKEEQLIRRLETITPKELLEDLSQGKNASESDMRKVSNLMIEQGLPAPVMNVAIYYVMLQSNMMLSQKYLATIVSNWSRLNFKTAREAMTFAKQQINQSKQNQQQQRRYSYNRQPTNKEVLPAWFKERKAPQEESTKEAPKEPALTQEQLDKQAQLRAQLDQLASKKSET